MSAVQRTTCPRHQENGCFPDGSRSQECGQDAVPENPADNQRELGPLVESFSGAHGAVINTCAPRALVIAPLSSSVRPLSANVRPRGWLLSRNVRPRSPLLSRPVD